jgi:hypothetical protein
MKAWTSPVRLLSLFLFFLSIAATISWARLDVMTWFVCVRNALLIIGSGWLVYRALLPTKKIKPTRWEHRVITGLILFLLFDPLLPWYFFPIIGIVTEVAQRFIRVATGPIFNPASLGVFVMSFFGFLPGWWGASFSPRIPVPFLDINGISIASVFVVPIAGYIAHKYKKLPIAITAAAVFAVLYLIVYQSNPAIILLEGTLAFFLLVMAVEPKTSPVIFKEQLAFGTVICLFIILGIHFGMFDPYVFALLVANALLQIYRYIQKKKMLAKAAVAQSAPSPATPPFTPAV